VLCWGYTEGIHGRSKDICRQRMIIYSCCIGLKLHAYVHKAYVHLFFHIYKALPYTIINWHGSFMVIRRADTFSYFLLHHYNPGYLLMLLSGLNFSARIKKKRTKGSHSRKEAFLPCCEEVLWHFTDHTQL
jgi:hypothetical protein